MKNEFVARLKEQVEKWSQPPQQREIFYWDGEGVARSHLYPLGGTHYCGIPGCPANGER